MPAGVAEELERVQFGEAWKGVQTDAAQFQEEFVEPCPVPLRHLRDHALAGRQLLRASAQKEADEKIAEARERARLAAELQSKVQVEAAEAARIAAQEALQSPAQ